MTGHDQDELMRITEIKNRIVEVLAKYNRSLENAPLDALAMAMEHMIKNRTRNWGDVFTEFKP